MSDLKDLSQKRYWGGILALGGVVFIWVSSSFAMNVNIYLIQRLPWLLNIISITELIW